MSLSLFRFRGSAVNKSMILRASCSHPSPILRSRSDSKASILPEYRASIFRNLPLYSIGMKRLSCKNAPSKLSEPSGNFGDGQNDSDCLKLQPARNQFTYSSNRMPHALKSLSHSPPPLGRPPFIPQSTPLLILSPRT